VSEHCLQTAAHAAAQRLLDADALLITAGALEGLTLIDAALAAVSR
jgi:hypothetical protein